MSLLRGGLLIFLFTGDVVPEGYSLKKMAFVEKLVINDDPEYQWIDKIRTPRASNEARQTLFMKLSSTVQRKIGLMALELGANAVLGYVNIPVHDFMYCMSSSILSDCSKDACTYAMIAIPNLKPYISSEV